MSDTDLRVAVIKHLTPLRRATELKTSKQETCPTVQLKSDPNCRGAKWSTVGGS